MLRHSMRCRLMLVCAGVAGVMLLTACVAISPAPPLGTDASVAGATPTHAAAPATDVLYVDAAQQLGPIDSKIYGAAWGPWMVIRPETMPLLEVAGIGMIAYPGGEWGDQRDLQSYEIDNFLSLSRKFGAEPLIHVRLPGGAPERAADLVRYTNVEKGYGVTYWAIGNEPNLYPPRYTDEPWDAHYFADQWRHIAQAMKAVDPSILLVGPEITNYVGEGDGIRAHEQEAAEWMRVFLETNGDLVDVVSFHRYPFPLNMQQPADTTVEDLAANSPEWEQIIPALKALMLETIGRELPIAVTEVNSHYTKASRGEATPESVANAVWYANVLMRMIRTGVDQAAYWALSMGDEQGVWGMVNKYDPRPAYFTFLLYSKFGDELLHAVSAAPDVDLLAAQRGDALTVMITNQSRDARSVTLTIENAEYDAASEVWRLDEAVMGEQIVETISVGAPITLPPLSQTLLIFE